MRFPFPLSVVLLSVGVPCIGPSALAVTQSEVRFDGRGFRVLTINLQTDELRVVYKHPDGSAYGNFVRLRQGLGDKYLAAANAGMFETNGSPTGLLKADGAIVKGVNLGTGVGNFYLKPNGVFFMTSKGAAIAESQAFAREFTGTFPSVSSATQSGPLLVSNGKINSRLIPGSHCQQCLQYSRTAVAVISPTHVAIALGLNEINFYDFAAFLLNGLHSTDALYLDGAISKLDTLEKPTNDRKQKYAAFIAVLKR
jgi:uncharacterized protein YigE (DUF2233 family)